MQPNAPTISSPDVPALVCAAITLALAYAYTFVLTSATGELAGTSAYVEAARPALQVFRVLMVATSVLLFLRAIGVQIPSKVTRGVFTAAMGGMPVCYVIVRWDAL